MRDENKDIVLDADGVILDFESSFLAVAKRLLGREVALVTRKYELDLRYGMSVAEVDATWVEFYSGGAFADIKPLPGAEQAVKALQDGGYRIHVVTGIPENHLDQRLENFAKFGFVPTSIHGVGHGRASKTPKIRSISPIAFVDDRLEHLHAVPETPNLVWIDHGDEQHPAPGGRVDYRTSSLVEWAAVFLDNASRSQPARKVKVS